MSEERYITLQVKVSEEEAKKIQPHIEEGDEMTLQTAAEVFAQEVIDRYFSLEYMLR